MDWNYVLKRVIVGVVIFLIIYFLKSYILLDVHAQEMSSTNVGAQTVTVTPGTAFADFDIQGNPWANWRLGHLYFNFGITKTAGSSTDPIIVPRFIQAKSDTAVYICNFGTASYSNSTFTGASYSVDCPMDMGWPGLTGISIGFMPFQASSSTTYNVQIGGWMTFEQNANTQVNVDTSGTTSAINNQITNDNTNTTNIINNQNQNTDKEIESQKVCNTLSFGNDVLDTPGYIGASGSINSSSQSYYTSSYIPVNERANFTLYVGVELQAPAYCWYKSDKTILSCTAYSGNLTIAGTVPLTAKFIRYSGRLDLTIFSTEFCQNGNQAIADGQQQINDTLNNSNVDGSTSNGSNFFLNFADHTNPLLDILLFPIRLLDSANDSCSPIPIEYLNTTINIPCGDTIFWNRSDVSPFRIWWNLFVGGIAIYYLSLKLFNIVNDSFDPFKDPMNHVGGF